MFLQNLLSPVVMVCRTCLKTVQNKANFHTIVDSGEAAENIQHILQLCIPELDIYLSDSPGICDDCLHSLHAFYQFKSRCLATEDRLHDYAQQYNKNGLNKSNNKIDLFVAINSTSCVNNLETVALTTNDQQQQQQHLNITSEINSHTSQLLPCKRCFFITTDWDTLTNHKCIGYTAQAQYKCTRCSYVTKRQTELTAHLKQCQRQIQQTVQQQQTIQQQQKEHQPKMETEQTSNILTSNPVHQILVYKCDLCTYTAASQLLLKRHMTAVHGPPVYQCQYCVYSTKDRSNFKKHQFSHGGKLIKCMECGYECVSPYQMGRHVKIRHA